MPVSLPRTCRGAGTSIKTHVLGEQPSPLWGAPCTPSSLSSQPLAHPGEQAAAGPCLLQRDEDRARERAVGSRTAAGGEQDPLGEETWAAGL